MPPLGWHLDDDAWRRIQTYLDTWAAGILTTASAYPRESFDLGYLQILKFLETLGAPRRRADGLWGGGCGPFDRAKEKFEFPVKWGIDLQSEHETLSDGKIRKKARHLDELPEGHQSLLHAGQ